MKKFKTLFMLNLFFIVITAGLILTIVIPSFDSTFFPRTALIGFWLWPVLGLFQLIIMIYYGFYLRLLSSVLRKWYFLYWWVVVFIFISMLITINLNLMEGLSLTLIFTIFPTILCLYFSRAMTQVNNQKLIKTEEL